MGRCLVFEPVSLQTVARNVVRKGVRNVVRKAVRKGVRKVARAWALMLCAATAAAPASAQTLPTFTATERASILRHGPWPPPLARDPANAQDGRAQAIALGRRLFFDPSLSAEGDLSCASCHDPATAFQDGRRTPKYGTRNTPSLLDVAQQRWFGWGGASDSLWAASLAPMSSANEMGPPRLDSATLIQHAKALAAYQATLVSPRTTFDAFRDALARGDSRAAAAYPLAAQRGLRIFVGEGRCNVCHSGPLFSNGEFADIGVPFFVPDGVDSGRHDGLKSLMTSVHNRLGPHNDAGAARDPRAVLTRQLDMQPRHFGEFRVPGLRNVANTAPYMHDGSLPTLADVVRHYSELNEERLHADGERILRPLKLTAEQTADLVAFLQSLSR